MSLPQPETDPRLAIRADLLAAGRRRTARRQRRRGATLAAVAVAGVLGTAGAAAKLNGSSVGVPVIDQVIENSAERRPPAPSRNREGKIVGPPPFDIRPGRGAASKPLKVPWGADGSAGTGIGVAYLNRSDHLCFVLVAPKRRADETGYGCTLARGIEARLKAAPVAIATGGNVDRDRPHLSGVKGFARADVVALRYHAPGGPVNATLGQPWKPGSADAKPIRPFVALFRFDHRGIGPRRTVRAMSGDLTATLADGRVVEIPRGS
jgi:hypothetical protein